MIFVITEVQELTLTFNPIAIAMVCNGFYTEPSAPPILLVKHPYILLREQN
jgi:flagellar biosynthesis protein FliQ